MTHNPAELAQTLFEESGDALFLFDPDSEQLVDGNPMAQRLTGYTRRELLTMQVMYLFRSEVGGSLQRLRHACKHTGIFHSQEGYLLRHRQDGVWVPVNLTVTRLHAEPRTLGLVTARDISERREAQVRIEKAESELRQVMASVSDAMWSGEIDRHGRWVYRYISPVLERISGRPPEYYSGPERWLTTIHPEDRPRLEAALQRLLTGQTRREEEVYRLVRPDGAVRWVRDSVQASPGQDGRSLRCDGVISDITERKLAEEARRESEERFRSFMDRNVAIAWMKDDAGRYVYMNQTFVERFACPQSWRGLTDFDLFPEEVARASRDSDLEVFRTDRTLEAHRNLPDPQGVNYVWWVLKFPFLDPAGKRFVGGIAIDITERKRAEEDLARERDLLHALMENVPVLIYFKDADSRYARINRFEAAALGLADARDAIGKSDFDFYPEELAREFHADEQQLIRTGQPLLNKLERQTGVDANERWILSTKVPMRQDDRIVGIVGVSQDVSERMRTEQALRSSEAKYRSLIENLEQSIFLKDRELRFVAANKHFCLGVGLTEEELVGKTDLDLYPLHMAEKYRGDDLLVLTEANRLELEEQSLVQGSMRTVRVIKTPVRDDRGAIVGVLGIFWDVTEQRALEAQLRQAQKMEAVGLLAGGVAHDFNNLLTAVLGNVALVLSSQSQTDPNRDLLVAAERGALRAAELTNQLLGFSRRSILRLMPLNLKHAIDETLRILRRTIDPRITLEIANDLDLWMVHADPAQVNQVLMNLCLNARDAMPEGGKLLIAAENVALDNEYARLHLEARVGDFVRLTVSDTGQGIPAEIRGRIFEPFFTTKEPGHGTGLGLAMVFGIVKQHRGWIDCYTEVGAGTRFHIYLPRHRSAGEMPTALAAPSKPSHGKETILLADDEHLLRDLGQNILRHYGYEVILAEDGRGAVDIYQREQHRIQLVILDLTMPRLSGRDAMAEILRINPEARVLLASGYSSEHISPNDNARILGFVNKPYRPEDLAHAVRSALDRPARARGAKTSTEATH